MTTAPVERPGTSRALTLPLLPGRVPLGTPMMVGLMVGFGIANSLALSGRQEPAPLIAGLVAALLVGTVVLRWLRRSVPDRVRLAGDALELARGDTTLRRLELSKLSEVNQLPTPAGPVLVLADQRRTLALAQAQLAEPRRWDELSQAILEVVERADPTGASARRAVRAGRLREEISKQPARATGMLIGVVALTTVLGWQALDALSDKPFPREELGALAPPLVEAGEAWRIFGHMFQHPSFMALLLVLAGILWLGSWLEKLVGWERVLVGFTAGGAGTAATWVTLGYPLPFTGAAGGVAGLLGAVAAVTVLGRRTLPRALLPRAEFWGLTLPYVVLLSFATMMELAPGGGLPMLLAPVTLLGGVAASFVLSAALLAGSRLPPAPSDRRHAQPFAVLCAIALGIGAVGGVIHMRAGHAMDTELLTRSYLALPRTPQSAEMQNAVAYLMLIAPNAGAESVDVATRIAEAAVVGSGRTDARILDTLAVARFRQGEQAEAKELLQEALRLTDGEGPADRFLRKFLQRRLKDVEAGGPLTPDSEP